MEEIKRVAELHKANVNSIDLKAQFRCSGAEGFVNWIDDVLQLETTGNFDGWDTEDFMFKICDSPNELRYLINQEMENGANARILAGYAWPWTAARNGNANGQIEDVNISEFEFSMPWNSRQIGTTWAIDDDGINQIGCVHTSQGLEFDYVGIIVGKDLQFNPETNSFFTNWNEYFDTKGKQGLAGKPEELNRLVRNIYRILFTRAMKGCYVYFVDKETEKYFKSRIE